MSTATTALTSGKDLDPALARAIRSHYAELCFNDILTEKTQIRFVQAGERLGWAKGRIDSMHAQTAAWTYIQPHAVGNTERGGYHLILLGDQFASAMRPELRSQEECRLAFARLLLDHEAMHARHTERNPHIVARAAKQAGITHLDFNLGEDIRIEERGRTEFNRPFDWIRYQDPPEHPASRAQVALYAAYHAESASSTVLDRIRMDGGSLRQADLVGEYFYLLAHATSSVDIPPLMAGFLTKWSGSAASPATPPPSSSGAASQAGSESTGSGGPGAPPSPAGSDPAAPGSPAPGGSAAADSASGSPSPQPDGATPNPTPASSGTIPSEREALEASSQPGLKADPNATAPASATPQLAQSKASGDGPGADAESAPTSHSDRATSGAASACDPDAAPMAPITGAADGLQGQESGPGKDQEGSSTEASESSAPSTAASPAAAESRAGIPASTLDQANHERGAANGTGGTSWEDVGSFDLWLQDALAAEPSLLDDLLATTTDMIDPPTAQEIANQAGNVGLHIDLAYTTSSDILVPAAVADELGTTLDQNRIRACVRILRQALGDRQEIVHRDSLPGRLNYRRAAHEDDRPFGRKLPGNDCGPTEVVMVIDCSSSMSGGGADPGAGSPIAEARHLAAAFNVLARERKVAGHIVLSMVGHTADGRHAAVCQTIALPMPERDIRRIEAYGGGEGLAATLTTIQPLAKKSDMTFLYTDGNITDQAIDKEALHKKGIYTYGVYVGGIERCSKLSRYVDHAIQGNQLDVAVSRLVTILKAHRTRRAH